MRANDPKKVGDGTHPVSCTLSKVQKDVSVSKSLGVYRSPPPQGRHSCLVVAPDFGVMCYYHGYFYVQQHFTLNNGRPEQDTLATCKGGNHTLQGLNGFLLVLITVKISAFRISHLLVTCRDKEEAFPGAAVDTGSVATEHAPE